MPEPETGQVPLAAEFPTAMEAQWLALVETVLKGRPFETLTSHTYDNLSIAPLYRRRAHAQPLLGRHPGAAWQVLQRVDHPDPAAANAAALHDLENGATGLSLVFAGAVGGYGFGLPPTAAAIEQSLDSVYLNGATIDLDAGPGAADAALALTGLVKRQGIAAQNAQIRFGLDPLGAAAQDGVLRAPWNIATRDFVCLVRDLDAQGFRGPFACADGRVVHAAGGSEAQELSFALAAAVAYLRALEAEGIALHAARGMIYVRLAADADQLLTTAKFRAMRKLWGRIEQACGLGPAPLFVSAETAWRMMTRRDPYVNMLRTTVATFAAAVGGANAISALPFTAALGLPDRFARRVARNTQLILAEESHLPKVNDPSAGSGVVESLTDELCHTAWTLFQEIEAAGGVAAALQAGLLQEKVARVRSEREKAVAHRRDALTGTSEFPLLSEPSVAVLDLTPAPLPALPPTAEVFPPLSPMRLAAPFEALRDVSDRHLAATGMRPRVFLANLGAPSDFLARATFARNFFEAGGIEAVSAEQADNLANGFETSGARLACICSSDALYATDGATVAQTLKCAGAQHIYLAGRPGSLEATLRAAGVQSFVYAGCNAVATLQAAHDILKLATDSR